MFRQMDERSVYCLRAGDNPGVVLVDGVALSPSAVSRLTRLLQEEGHTEVAMRLVLAVDTSLQILKLSPEDRVVVLRVLRTCPDELLPLRRSLHARQQDLPDSSHRGEKRLTTAEHDANHTKGSSGSNPFGHA
jgi:hypothetical protein